MKIIGISGKKQSGKDTVCDILIRQLAPARCIRIAFADALKLEVAQACKVTVPYINEHKQNFRLILQGWGTEYRRQLYGEQYWTMMYLKKILSLGDAYDYVITPDVRFKNEYECIHEIGYPVIRVCRMSDGELDTHASENDLDSMSFAAIIDNNNSLSVLEQQVIKILPKIK